MFTINGHTFTFEEILQIVGVVLLSFYVLWVLYLAVMNLKRVKNLGLLKPVAVVLAVPILVLGFLLDVILNFVVMTVILLEIPRELTVSERLKRHNEKGGWRKKVAQLFEPILDPFDPSGNHI